MKYLLLAVSFLTVIPVRLKETPRSGDMGRAGPFFPVVGALIGAITGLAYWGFSLLFPSYLAAIFSVGVWICLTGGLHLDGLADCADGLFNASSPERRLEIMKDPRLGSFGGLALILAVITKIGLMMALPPQTAWLSLAACAASARWLLLVAGRLPLARPGGMGADFAGGLSTLPTMLAAILPAMLSLACGWRGLTGLSLALLAALWVFHLARRRIGGVTGDVFGFTVELAELAFLVGLVVRS